MSGMADTETNPFQRQLDNLNYRLLAATADDDESERRSLYREYLVLLDYFEHSDREADRRAIVAAGGAPIAYVQPIAQTTKAANVSPPRHAHREDTPIMHTQSTDPTTAVINAVTIECDLRLGQMEVSPEYQRPTRQVWMRKLVKEFSPALVGKIRVAERDGHYYVIDGQHRVEAMRVIFAGDEDRLIRCDVQIIETAEEQARLFVSLNTARSPMRPHDIFRARLAANDDAALAIVDLLERYGFRAVMSGGTLQPGTTVAFSTLDRMYGSHLPGLGNLQQSGVYGGRGGGSPERLERTLAILADAYADEVVLTITVLRSVDSFLFRYADHANYKRSRFVSTLAGMDIEHGRDVGKLAALLNVSRVVAIPIVIAQKYNGRLPAAKRLPIRIEQSVDDEAEAA